MKKIISVILISIATLGLMACADTAQNKATAEKSVVEESNKGTEETNENDRQEDRTSEENTPSEQENITESSGKQVLVVYFFRGRKSEEIRRIF